MDFYFDDQNKDTDGILYDLREILEVQTNILEDIRTQLIILNAKTPKIKLEIEKERLERD